MQGEAAVGEVRDLRTTDRRTCATPPHDDEFVPWADIANVAAAPAVSPVPAAVAAAAARPKPRTRSWYPGAMASTDSGSSATCPAMWRSNVMSVFRVSGATTVSATTGAAFLSAFAFVVVPSAPSSITVTGEFVGVPSTCVTPSTASAALTRTRS